ncbi:MAG: hypothetical protein DWQ02_01470 [Bacteroidetes bacterium]|nr:MAG: hypothetical protein DWQ02_01470 [Bacteroidota bacterium]
MISISQVLNGNFESWFYDGNWETPLHWDCESVSSDIGSCDKIENPDGSFSARVHNVMPCVNAESIFCKRFLKTHR